MPITTYVEILSGHRDARRTVRPGFPYAAFPPSGSENRVRTRAFFRAFHVGALIACSGILMHSFVDFNLHITANYLLFLVNAGLATAPVFGSAAPRRGPKRVGIERN